MFRGYIFAINDKGEILSFAITQANVEDRKPLKNENFLKDIFGKLFGNKGYISKELTKFSLLMTFISLQAFVTI